MTTNTRNMSPRDIADAMRGEEMIEEQAFLLRASNKPAISTENTNNSNSIDVRPFWRKEDNKKVGKLEKVDEKMLEFSLSGIRLSETNNMRFKYGGRPSFTNNPMLDFTEGLETNKDLHISCIAIAQDTSTSTTEKVISVSLEGSVSRSRAIFVPLSESYIPKKYYYIVKVPGDEDTQEEEEELQVPIFSHKGSFEDIMKTGSGSIIYYIGRKMEDLIYSNNGGVLVSKLDETIDIPQKDTFDASIPLMEQLDNDFIRQIMLDRSNAGLSEQAIFLKLKKLIMGEAQALKRYEETKAEHAKAVEKYEIEKKKANTTLAHTLIPPAELLPFSMNTIPASEYPHNPYDAYIFIYTTLFIWLEACTSQVKELMEKGKRAEIVAILELKELIDDYINEWWRFGSINPQDVKSRCLLNHWLFPEGIEKTLDTYIEINRKNSEAQIENAIIPERRETSRISIRYNQEMLYDDWTIFQLIYNFYISLKNQNFYMDYELAEFERMVCAGFYLKKSKEVKMTLYIPAEQKYDEKIVKWFGIRNGSPSDLIIDAPCTKEIYEIELIFSNCYSTKIGTQLVEIPHLTYKIRKSQPQSQNVIMSDKVYSLIKFNFNKALELLEEHFTKDESMEHCNNLYIELMKKSKIRASSKTDKKEYDYDYDLVELDNIIYEGFSSGTKNCKITIRLLSDASSDTPVSPTIKITGVKKVDVGRNGNTMVRITPVKSGGHIVRSYELCRYKLDYMDNQDIGEIEYGDPRFNVPNNTLIGPYAYQVRVLEVTGKSLKYNTPMTTIVPIGVGGGKTSVTISLARYLELLDVGISGKPLLIYSASSPGLLKEMFKRCALAHINVYGTSRPSETYKKNNNIKFRNNVIGPGACASGKSEPQFMFEIEVLKTASMIVCHTRTLMYIIAMLEEHNGKYSGRPYITIIDEIDPGKINKETEHALGAYFAMETRLPKRTALFSASADEEGAIRYYMKNHKNVQVIRNTNILVPTELRQMDGSLLDPYLGYNDETIIRKVEKDAFYKRFISLASIAQLKSFHSNWKAQYEIDNNMENYFIRMMEADIIDPASLYITYPYHKEMCELKYDTITYKSPNVENPYLNKMVVDFISFVDKSYIVVNEIVRNLITVVRDKITKEINPNKKQVAIFIFRELQKTTSSTISADAYETKVKKYIEVNSKEIEKLLLKPTPVSAEVEMRADFLAIISDCISGMGEDAIGLLMKNNKLIGFANHIYAHRNATMSMTTKIKQEYEEIYRFSRDNDYDCENELSPYLLPTLEKTVEIIQLFFEAITDFQAYRRIIISNDFPYRNEMLLEINKNNLTYLEYLQSGYSNVGVDRYIHSRNPTQEEIQTLTDELISIVKKFLTFISNRKTSSASEMSLYDFIKRKSSSISEQANEFIKNNTFTMEEMMKLASDSGNSNSNNNDTSIISQCIDRRKLTQEEIQELKRASDSQNPINHFLRTKEMDIYSFIENLVNQDTYSSLEPKERLAKAKHLEEIMRNSPCVIYFEQSVSVPHSKQSASAMRSENSGEIQQLLDEIKLIRETPYYSIVACKNPKAMFEAFYKDLAFTLQSEITNTFYSENLTSGTRSKDKEPKFKSDTKNKEKGTIVEQMKKASRYFSAFEDVLFTNEIRRDNGEPLISYSHNGEQRPITLFWQYLVMLRDSKQDSSLGYIGHTPLDNSLARSTKTKAENVQATPGEAEPAVSSESQSMLVPDCDAGEGSLEKSRYTKKDRAHGKGVIDYYEMYLENKEALLKSSETENNIRNLESRCNDIIRAYGFNHTISVSLNDKSIDEIVKNQSIDAVYAAMSVSCATNTDNLPTGKGNRLFCDNSCARGIDLPLESVIVTKSYEDAFTADDILQLSGRCGRPSKSNTSVVYMSASCYRKTLVTEENQTDAIKNVMLRMKFYQQAKSAKLSDPIASKGTDDIRSKHLLQMVRDNNAF
jgi:hypothetical protein